MELIYRIEIDNKNFILRVIKINKTKKYIKETRSINI